MEMVCVWVCVCTWVCLLESMCVCDWPRLHANRRVFERVTVSGASVCVSSFGVSPTCRRPGWPSWRWGRVRVGAGPPGPHRGRLGSVPPPGPAAGFPADSGDGGGVRNQKKERWMVWTVYINALKHQILIQHVCPRPFVCAHLCGCLLQFVHVRICKCLCMWLCLCVSVFEYHPQ